MRGSSHAQFFAVEQASGAGLRESRGMDRPDDALRQRAGRPAGRTQRLEAGGGFRLRDGHLRCAMCANSPIRHTSPGADGSLRRCASGASVPLSRRIDLEGVGAARPLITVCCWGGVDGCQLPDQPFSACPAPRPTSTRPASRAASSGLPPASGRRDRVGVERRARESPGAFGPTGVANSAVAKPRLGNDGCTAPGRTGGAGTGSRRAGASVVGPSPASRRDGRTASAVRSRRTTGIGCGFAGSTTRMASRAQAHAHPNRLRRTADLVGYADESGGRVDL